MGGVRIVVARIEQTSHIYPFLLPVTRERHIRAQWQSLAESQRQAWDTSAINELGGSQPPPPPQRLRLLRAALAPALFAADPAHATATAAAVAYKGPIAPRRAFLASA